MQTKVSDFCFIQACFDRAMRLRNATLLVSPLDNLFINAMGRMYVGSTTACAHELRFAISNG